MRTWECLCRLSGSGVAKRWGLLGNQQLWGSWPVRPATRRLSGPQHPALWRPSALDVPVETLTRPVQPYRPLPTGPADYGTWQAEPLALFQDKPKTLHLSLTDLQVLNSWVVIFLLLCLCLLNSIGR